MFNWFKKKKTESRPRVVDLAFKTWEDFTKEELIDIAKMLGEHAYGDVTLNFNDTFAIACAWGVDCDQFDLPVVAELYKKYGSSGVVAWAAIKEKAEPLSLKYLPHYKEAKKEIEGDLLKFYWDLRIKKRNEDKNGKA